MNAITVWTDGEGVQKRQNVRSVRGHRRGRRHNFSSGVNVCHADGIIFPVTTRVNSTYKSEPLEIFKNKYQ